MKKADLLSAVIDALTQSSIDDIRPYLAGRVSCAFDRGDKDAVALVEAMAKRSVYVKKYLDKARNSGGRLFCVGSDRMFGDEVEGK